ncbi:TPA: DHH family phosphoesterase [Clostridium perfringens]
MKYYLNEKSSNNYMTDNLLRDILKTRGISDINEYCYPKGKYEEDYNNLAYIKEAVKCLLKHIENNNRILVGVDPDVDGYTAAASLINYLKKNFKGINLIYKLHTGKQHGLTDDIMPIEDDVKLVIMPDASSNDYIKHKELKDKGIDIIVLDHHEAEKVSENAIVVNNQLCNYKNKHLSGVGIVYKFLQAIDEEFWRNDAENYIDLVALGLIGDSMEVTSLETRYYIYKGLNNIKNKQLKALLSKQEYSIKGKINMTNIAFYIVPLINAMIRVGKQEEKELLFKGFVEEYQEFDYKPRGATESTKEDIYTRAARLCANTKSRQDKLRNKAFDEVDNIIKLRNKINDKILIVNCTNLVDSGLVGVVAIKIADKYNRPCVLLKKSDSDTFGGSGRNTDFNEVKDLKSILNKSEMFELAEGHPQAFGVKIKRDNIERFIKYANEELNNIEFDGNTYCVDCIIPFEYLEDDFIAQSEALLDYWGKGVSELKVAITDIDLKSSEIKLLGKTKNTVKFNIDGIDFIKFQALNDELSVLAESSSEKDIKLDVVGRLSTNEWNGKKTLQIMVDDYNIL